MAKGILLLATGLIIMMVNSWFSYQFRQSLPVTALKVLLEPAGWFLLWAALDFLFYGFAELKKKRIFYQGLSEMQVHFKSS